MTQHTGLPPAQLRASSLFTTCRTALSPFPKEQVPLAPPLPLLLSDHVEEPEAEAEEEEEEEEEETVASRDASRDSVLHPRENGMLEKNSVCPDMETAACQQQQDVVRHPVPFPSVSAGSPPPRRSAAGGETWTELRVLISGSIRAGPRHKQTKWPLRAP